MNKYLPSKQFVKTIGIALIIGFTLFFLGNFLSKRTVWEQKKDSRVAAVSGSSEDYFSRDSDGDGLYDWEESLWGTNSSLVSSRNDGVSDYDYVQNKKKNLTFSDEYKPNLDNDTEVFARQLLTTSSVLNQSGGLNQDQIEEFSRGLSTSIESFNIKDKYTLANLKLSNISALDYRNNIVALYERLNNKDINELMLIAYILENPEDSFGYDELGNLLSFYDGVMSGLLSMNVPHANAGIHLAIINDVFRISEIMRQVKIFSADPLKTTTYLSKYNQYSESLSRNYSALGNYFSSNGII